jgi:hypothetical protein
MNTKDVEITGNDIGGVCSWKTAIPVSYHVIGIEFKPLSVAVFNPIL